uniref:Uncharacterized protein n=1 Tax=Siphoviridae sp. ctfYP22 TaxID=2827584 RepID=A0A8S5LIY4_9CAUD|nr:MAG TPA: hypothetical protein [Siphoviridae sp. ctfYP22]
MGIPLPLGCNSPCELVAPRCMCQYLKERAGANCSPSWLPAPLGGDSLPRCSVAKGVRLRSCTRLPLSLV